MNLAPYITSIFNILKLIYHGLIDYWYIFVGGIGVILIARVIFSLIRGK